MNTIRMGQSTMKRCWSTLRLVVRVVEDWRENEILWDECWLTTGGVLENSGRCLEYFGTLGSWFHLKKTSTHNEVNFQDGRENSDYVWKIGGPTRSSVCESGGREG